MAVNARNLVAVAELADDGSSARVRALLTCDAFAFPTAVALSGGRHVRALVGGVVVHDDVQLHARMGGGDLLQEPQELLACSPDITQGGLPQAQPSAPALTASQAVGLLTRLTSGDSAAVTSAIAMPNGQEVLPRAEQGSTWSFRIQDLRDPP